MCQHFYAQPGKYPLDLAEMDSEPVQQKLVVNAVNALGSNVLIRHAAVKKALRITQIGWVKVRLPGREEHLSLVVSRLAGCDTPLMLETIDSGTTEIIPEPATMVLLGLGGLVLRRKK